MHYINYYNSPFGTILLASDGIKLIGLWFENQKYYGSCLDERYIIKDLDVFNITKSWLDEYFIGDIPTYIPPISLNTTSFRQQVYEILLSIPYGQTISYSDIAMKICEINHCKNMSAQAVGNAISHNPISLIIPCHRVIGKNSHLIGYAGGLELKKKLLEHEKMNKK